MTMQRTAIAVTALNLVLLMFTLLRPTPAETQASASPVLRGRALELVDANGRVRSRLDVEPSGEVVFRLLDQNGSIRVKLGADRLGSGLVLLDEATEPGVHIVARRKATTERPATTSVSLRGPGAQLRKITP